MKTEVYCKLTLEGMHNWENCPHPEVAYLRDLHRHIFHITAYKEVTHADRDVEFIILGHRIREYLNLKYIHSKVPSVAHVYNLHMFGSMSCEMIAEELINEFDLSRCEVSEDGENGAFVTK